MKKIVGLVLIAAAGAWWVRKMEMKKSSSTMKLKNEKSDFGVEGKKPKSKAQKMDDIIEDSFPASDPPSWNSSAV